MKRRRKTIIAGNLVKVIESTIQLPRDTPQARRDKREADREAKKAANVRTAQGHLEETLACNFSSLDYFVTLTYRKGEEPKNRREAKKHKAQYIRRLRDARARRGQPLRWIWSIECKHGKGRYHHHAAVNAIGFREDREELESLWPFGNVHIETMFNAGHDQGETMNCWLDIATYMTKERPEGGKDTTPNGWQIYSCSRGLRKPIVKHEYVEAGTPVEIPAGAIIYRNTEDVINQFGYYCYTKYLTAPIVRNKQSSLAEIEA